MVKRWAEHLKSFAVRTRKRQLVDRAWRERHGKVLELHPQYAEPCERDVEESHRAIWRRLRKKVSLQTLRICSNISGRSDPRIVPEEIYATEVEPALNRREERLFLTNKSVYERWFGKGVFPHCFLHNIDGVFYGPDYERLSDGAVEEVVEGLDYPVVVKASMGPHGGRAVHFPEGPDQLLPLMEGWSNFVVQERIRQHPFLERFNQHGLNTIRACVYRSVETDDVHVLDSALRMGKGGSLDNETQGGIVCHLGEDGRLNDYAVDKYGGKFSAHPDSGLAFAEQDPIPGFEDMERLVSRTAESVYFARLISLDVCLDAEGGWRIIEVNLGFQTIRFAQYAGKPFFGEFTDEVIDYVEENPRWC